MERSKLSLKWLEVFQAVARSGSVRDGAAELGVTASTVSHHLNCLERAVGAQLVDHTRRPMQLTPEGATLLRRVDEAMWLLRRGVTELWSEDLSSLVRLLRVALVEDFDTEVAPALARELSRTMPECEFSILSRPSHEILELLQNEQVDIGVASTTETDFPGFLEKPVLRDPYILVTPLAKQAGDAFPSDLPFLRYSKKQLIGRRIEAQLRRMGLRLSGRMEFESTHAILALVTAGFGWTIMTALTYARAQRYHGEVRIAPFPGKAFSRQLSVFQRDDVPAELHELMARSLRASAQAQVIGPTVARYPWLDGRFCVLSDGTQRAGTDPLPAPLTEGSGTPL